MRRPLVCLTVLAGLLRASALTVDTTVSDHCVLQQNAQNVVKGTTTAGRTVSVKFSGGSQLGSATADASGNYLVKFNPGSANATGRSLVVSDGSASQTISDVLVGDVWLVAGQSNAYNSMDFNEYGGVFDDWMSDINYPNIRVAISSPQSGAGFSLSDPLVWQQCTTANRAKVAKISPLAFFFAKELHKGRNVPIGITLAGMGATAIGYFMTPEAIAAAKAAGKTPGWGNGEYAPYITRFDTVTAKGAVWYQGETDAIIGSGSGYGKLLTALIEDWRKHRGDSNFPVIVCGFANYAGTDHSSTGGSAYDGNYEGDYKNSTVRQEQEMVAQDLNNVVVYQNVDLSGNKLKGYARAEHPDQKPESAHRAYLAALNLVYGQSNVRYRCPYPTEAFFNAGKTKITVSFPSSVSLTKKQEYVHFPYRVKNGSTAVNPNSVTIGADGHSLEIGWTGLTIGSGDTKIAFCNVSGTPDDTPLYEIKIVDQDGFTIPPFELKVKDSSTGGDTHTHVWGTPTYAWTAGDTICIGTRKCTVSGCTMMQNVTASSVTLTVTTQPTEDTEGEGYRTAVFSSPYTTQTKNVTIPKLNPGTGGGDDPETPGGDSGDANGYEGVQLWANGPYWAKQNVGASAEEKEGLFFAWGLTEGFKVGGYQTSYPFGTNLSSPANGHSVAELKSAGICDATGVLAKAYDAASINMGGGWRMPTKAELSDLKANCDIVWDSDRKGLVITGRGAYESASIFLPCPGYVNQNGRANDKFTTNYLSSTPSGTEKAWSIFESSGGASVAEASRLNGFQIRAVITTIGSGDTPGGGDEPGTGGGDTPGGGDEPGTGGGDTPVTPTPAFGSADWYVSPSGNDSGNGSSAAPFQTIARAIEAASAGQKICVRKGTYNVKASGTMYADDAAITVGKAVTIFGETGNPADVIVHNSKNWSDTENYNTCYRVFTLDDAGAVLSGLTVENGIFRGSRTDTKFYGSNIKIAENGGTVTNCIIRNGHSDSIHTSGVDPSEKGGAAIACLSQNGLITHCVISNNFASMGRTSPNQTTQTGGTIVLLKAGTLRQSLIAYNTLSECWTASAVHAEENAGATTLVENCTIVYNKYVDGGSYGAYSDSGELYPIWVPLNSFDGKTRLPDIRNCLIYGNVTHSGGKALIDWSKYNDAQYSGAKRAAAEAFENCATDMTAPSGMTVTSVSAADMDGVRPKEGTALAKMNIGSNELGTGTGSGTVDPVDPVNPGGDDDEDIDPPGSGAAGTLDGHEGVQLWANGPYWATMNCGATKVGQAGFYYAGPGDTKGKSVSGGELTGKLIDNGSTTVWGNGWRRPTESDFQGLVDNTVYLGVETVDGQPNIKLGGKVDPYKDTFILIPVAGWGNNNAVNANPNCWGTQGRYWGSTSSGSFMRNLSIIVGSSSMKMELVSNHAQNTNIYSIRMCCESVSSGHTHVWDTPTYEWIQTSAGYKCKATGVCTDDASHVIVRTVTATYQEVTPATVGSDGLGRYTATFTDAPFTAQTKDIVIPKLHEHTYTTAPTYTWAKSGSGYICTGSIPCDHQGCTEAKTQTVTATYREVTPATEGSDGLGRYTATFTDAAFTQQTKDITIPKIPVGGDPNGYEGVQLWQGGPFWAKANVGAGSETDEGLFFSFGWVTGFSVGGYHVSYPFGTTTESPAVGMTLAQLKSAQICGSNGVLAKAYDAASVNMGGDWRMPTKADFESLLSNCDCVWDDSRKGLVATGRGDFDDVSIFLPCPGFVNQNGRANDKFQTYYLSATPSGTDEFYGLYMANNGVSLKSNAARANGFPVRGVIDSIRGYVPHTHSWSTPTYTWAATADGYTCTATVTCGGCNRTRSETVTATCQMMQAPTCTTPGSAIYTAAFTSYGTDTRTVALAPAHDWNTPTYDWSVGYSNCTGSAVCKLDVSHTVTEKAKMTFVVTQKPSITKTGLGYFVATFKKAPFVEQKSPDVVIPASDPGELPDANYYVALTGDDANDGTTPQTAFATIAKAIGSAVAGNTVCILDGTFELSEEIVIDKAITVVGLGFADTVIKPASGKKFRLVTLNNGAKLEGVTLTGGQGTKGAGALVLDGTLSWCCISNNLMTAHSSEGSGVSFSGGKGTVEHCIIANNKTSGQGSYGAGIGGSNPAGEILVDTCLIYGNKITGGGAGGGIGIKNMSSYTLTVRNCTITGNTGTMYTGGICREGGNGKVVLINTILFDNAYGSGGAASSPANIRCNNLIDTANSKNCLFGLASEPDKIPGAFSGNPLFENGYHLAKTSPAIHAGAAYDGIGKDLDGIAFAETPSIGCYELFVEAEHIHVWGEPDYSWVPTTDGYECTATAVCTLDPSHETTETATAFYQVVRAATLQAEGEGLYTAYFEEEPFTTQTKSVTIPKKEPVVLYAPVITPADGTEFTTDTCTVTITCVTPGATIYYTANGTTPRLDDAFAYTGPFVIDRSTTIKAVAAVDGERSDYVTAAITKWMPPIGEVVDAPDLTFTTGGDALWTVDGTVSKVGVSSARSGAMSAATTSDGRSSWLEVTVNGAGTLSFWWKVDCEKDVDGTCTWDHLQYAADGVEKGRIDGTTDWAQRTVTFVNPGPHKVRWTYFKDEYDGTFDGGDCGWVDAVVWTPSESGEENPPSGSWDIPGVKGGIAGNDNGNGGKCITISSFSIDGGKMKVDFEAAKVDANGETFGLVCKENLSDDTTFIVNAVLANEDGGQATTGTLVAEMPADKPKLFVIGIGPAK